MRRCGAACRPSQGTAKAGRGPAGPAGPATLRIVVRRERGQKRERPRGWDGEVDISEHTTLLLDGPVLGEA